MKKFLAFVSLLAFPAFTFAGINNFSSLQDTLNSIQALVNMLIPFAISIGVLVFIFGLIKYVTAGADEDGRKGARDTIIWGIIVIFVMTAVWGLVNVLSSTLGFTRSDNTIRRDELPKALPLKQ